MGTGSGPDEPVELPGAIADNNFCQCVPKIRMIWGVFVVRRTTNTPHIIRFEGTHWLKLLYAISLQF